MQHFLHDDYTIYSLDVAWINTFATFYSHPIGRTVVVTQEATLGVNHLHEQTGAEECGFQLSAGRLTMHSATMLNARNRDTLIGANVFWFPAIGGASRLSLHGNVGYVHCVDAVKEKEKMLTETYVAATFVGRFLYAMTPHTHLVVDTGLLNDTTVTVRYNKLPLNASLKKVLTFVFLKLLVFVFFFFYVLKTPAMRCDVTYHVYLVVCIGRKRTQRWA